METFDIKSEISDPPPPKQSRPIRILWLAVVSLLAVLLCMGVSIAIIVISDDQTIASWIVQPAVQLAILAALSNVALAIAFSEAVVSTWWASAENGASLEELHYIWSRGEGLAFFSALAAGPGARKVARTMLALIVIKVATGPLLQRATRQAIKEIVTEEAIKLNMTQRLPEGWGGTVNGRTAITASRNVRRITRAWWRNTSISTRGFCDGTCEGNVRGAGITHNCSSTTRPLHLRTANSTTVVFEINTTMSRNSAGAPVVVLTTLYTSAIDDNCIANLTIDTCEIVSGVVEYPVTLQKKTIKLNRSINLKDRIRSIYTDPGDSPNAALGSPAGTLRSLKHFANNFDNRAWWSSPTIFRGNLMAKLFFTDRDDFANGCALVWSSPTHFVLDSMHDFMFRAALSVGGATESQTVIIKRSKLTLVFHSVYRYLVATSIITLFGVFFVLIRLRWWSLGRPLSMSPLETAKAFCAPVMERGRYHTTTADEILEDLGQIRVKYVDEAMVVNENSTSSTDKPLLAHS
jgi:hypothetical protein